MPKISELTAISTLSGSETLPLVQSGTTKNVLLTDVRAGWISILDFIPKSEHAAIRAGTSTYDCTAALAAAIASRTVAGLGILVLTSGPQIYFPLGKYYFASTQHLKIRCHLKGEGSGLQGGWSTHFVFPAGTPGFVIHKENTDSTGTVAATTGADGTIIEDILMYGTNRVGFPNAHGIWLRARATLNRVVCQAFGGNAFQVVAAAGTGGFTEGNANCFRMDACTGLACGGHGLFTDGGDSNAGTVTMFDASDNLGCGIYDSSFLGNTYVGCHSSGNGSNCYKSDGANARNVFLGCYAEGGYTAADAINPAMFIGGLMGSGFTAGTTAFILDMDISGAFCKNGLQIPTAYIGYGQATASGVGLKYNDTAGVSNWTFEKTTGRWGYKWANGGVASHIMFYDTAATPGNGYARDVSSAAQPSGGNGALGIGPHYFGQFSEMKWRGLGTAAPVTGTWAQGDIIWNSTPASAGFIGWVCTVAGSPGTWKTFGLIS